LIFGSPAPEAGSTAARRVDELAVPAYVFALEIITVSAFFIPERAKSGARRAAFRSKSNFGAALPLDRSFLRGVDLRELDAFVVKENLHLVEEKFVRIGVRDVDPEMIDQLVLFLEPFLPAVLADFGADLLPELGRDRRVAERFVFQPAAGAFEFVA
jgi:hypothetical protein